MKYFIILLTSLFLFGCDQVPENKRSKDGYYFEKETFTRTEFPVEVVLVQSEKEMSRLLRERSQKVVGKIDAKDVAAFAVIRMNDSKCTIYMLDPKVKYQPEFIGHEFVHCIYGVWHSEPQV